MRGSQCLQFRFPLRKQCLLLLCDCCFFGTELADRIPVFGAEMCKFSGSGFGHRACGGERIEGQIEGRLQDLAQ